MVDSSVVVAELSRFRGDDLVGGFGARVFCVGGLALLLGAGVLALPFAEVDFAGSLLSFLLAPWAGGSSEAIAVSPAPVGTVDSVSATSSPFFALLRRLAGEVVLGAGVLRFLGDVVVVVVAVVVLALVLLVVGAFVSVVSGASAVFSSGAGGWSEEPGVSASTEDDA